MAHQTTFFGPALHNEDAAMSDNGSAAWTGRLSKRRATLRPRNGNGHSVHAYALARQEFKTALLEVVAFHQPGTPVELEEKATSLLKEFGKISWRT